jgi:hypothetical protein
VYFRSLQALLSVYWQAILFSHAQFDLTISVCVCVCVLQNFLLVCWKAILFTFFSCTMLLGKKCLLLLTMVTMVTMGGDLQPGCLADRLLTGLGQPQIYP